MSARLGAFLAVVFWGISFVATKAAVTEISPVALIFARAGLGTILLVGLLALRGRDWRPPRSDLGWLALMGFIGVAFHQGLQAYGLRLTTAVKTGWLIGLTPIWSAVLAALFLRERFPPAKLLGLVLGFAGALLVVTGGRFGSDVFALPSTKGDLLVLASTVNWAVYSVVGHPVIKRLGALRATAGAMLLAWVMLVVPMAVAGAWTDYGRLSAAGWAAVLFLGIASSGLGYLFWYGALETIETSKVAALLYIEPLVTLVAAWLLLGEPIGLVTLAGGALLLAGVALVQRAPAGK
jgi:drug/metabolite transporter (DMT)-like permease